LDFGIQLLVESVDYPDHHGSLLATELLATHFRQLPRLLRELDTASELVCKTSMSVMSESPLGKFKGNLLLGMVMFLFWRLAGGFLGRLFVDLHAIFQLKIKHFETTIVRL
jgi:hypothetical protein